MTLNTTFFSKYSFVLAFLFLSLAGASFSQNAVCFNGASDDSYVSGAGATAPQAVALGDFNRDGKNDVVVVNKGTGNIGILLGNGDGTYAPAVTYTVGTNPYAVAVGDFNNDTIPDIIVANSSTSNVSLLLGKGDGTFGAATNTALGSTGPQGIVVGDFNHDGNLDAATANNTGNKVTVLLGNGAGAFATPVQYAAGTTLNSIVAADFNRDGYLDLAVTNNLSSGTVTILMNSGSGTFGTPSSFSVGVNPYAVEAGDFNGDTIPDLAVVNFQSSTVSLLIGTGAGSFKTAIPTAVGLNPTGVAVADFNADGKLDIATSSLTHNAVAVAFGNGDGTFGSYSNYVTGAAPTALAAGNINADNHADIVVADRSSNAVSVLLNEGNGILHTNSTYTTMGTTPYSVATADLNRDGYLDLVTANYGGNNLTVSLGGPNGTFLTATTVSLGNNTKAHNVIAAYLNGDSIPDLAVTNSGNSNISVLIGNGDGTFKTPNNYTVGSTPYGLAAGDFNLDGKNDLVVTNYGSKSVSILLGNGDGTYQTATSFTTSIGTDPSAVVVADFNNDGNPDFAVTNYGTNAATSSVSVLLGTGSGTFTATTPATLTVGTNPNAIVAADFNGDGNPDIAVTNYTTSNVSVLLGVGNGTFAAQSTFAVAGYPTWLTAGDFNLDGNIDIAAANYGASNASVLVGLGTGQFSPAVNFGAGYQPRGIVAGDFNKDGLLDLAVANSSSNTISVLFNTTATVKSLGNTTICSNGHVALKATVGGYNYTWSPAQSNTDSINVNQAGNYSVTISNLNGTCITTSSAITVTVVSAYTSNNPQTICAGGSYTFNKHTYSAQGSYNDTLISVATGCDSIVTTQLNVIPLLKSSNPQTICASGSYTFNNHVYRRQGNYDDTLVSLLTGCDSIVTTQLTVIAPQTSNNPQSICSNASYTFNNHIYTKQGNYNDTLVSLLTGCDSIVTTQLTVIMPLRSNNLQTVCANGSYTFNQHTYTKQGNYNDTLLSVLTGCDSIITTQLTVLAPITHTAFQTICANSSYAFNNHLYSKTGTYHDTLTSKLSGCDSIVTTQLTVRNAITSNNPQMICSGSSYVINNHSYNAQGTYTDTLVSKLNGCDSIVTTQLTVSVCTGIAPTDNAPSIKVYPNPSNGFFTLECAPAASGKTIVSIYNIVGNQIYNEVVTANLTNIDLTGHASGVYFIRVQNDNGFVTRRVVLQ